MPITYLDPDGTDLNESDAWKNESASPTNPHLSIDDGATADEDTTFVKCNSSLGTRALRIAFGPMSDVVAISQIRALVRARTDGGAGGTNVWTPFVYIDSVEYAGSDYALSSTSYTDFTTTWATNPKTSNPWTQGDLNGLIFGLRQAVNATAQGIGTRVRIEVTYTPISGDLPVVRWLASHYLLMHRRPIPQLRQQAPLTALDNELGDDLSATHFAGPHPTGQGWGLTGWERRLHRIREMDLDLNSMTVSIVAEDRREQLTNVWETLEAIRTSLAEDGNARILPIATSAGATFARASDAWHEDPGSRLIARYGTDIKALAYQGLVIEGAATNYLVRGAFVNGTTGWTSDAGGGGVIAAESPPTNPLFASDVTNNCLKITGGGGFTQHIVTATTTGTVTASTKVRVRADHQDDATAVLSWRLQRSVDGWYWNDTSGAWQAGSVFNAFTVRTSRARDVSKVIDVGGSNTTLILAFQQPASTTLVNRVYCAEIAGEVPVGSRIVTDASAITRALATYGYLHTTTQQAIRPAGGTWQGFLTPFFSSSDFSSGTLTLWKVPLASASHYFEVRWNASTGNLEFAISQAGTVTTATKAITFTRDTEVYLAARWTSAAGELDLTARTHSIFIAGVKGTDATRAADPTDGAATLTLGNDGAAGVSGRWRRVRWRQVVLGDEEIARAAP